MDNGKKPIPSLAAHMGHYERRSKEVCMKLAEFFNARQQVQEHIFNKFKILYSHQLLQRAEVDNSEEFKEQIHHLSEEFRRHINPYKEFDVIDAQGNVLYTMPPHYLKFTSLDEQRAEALTAYDNTIAKNGDKPWAVQRAANNLMGAIGSMQDQKQIVSSAVDFMQKAKRLHDSGVLNTEFVGPGKFKVRTSATSQNETAATVKKEEHIENQIPDVKFEMDFGDEE